MDEVTGRVSAALDDSGTELGCGCAHCGWLKRVFGGGVGSTYLNMERLAREAPDWRRVGAELAVAWIHHDVGRAFHQAAPVAGAAAVLSTLVAAPRVAA